jgi:hypothetical protein
MMIEALEAAAAGKLDPHEEHVRTAPRRGTDGRPDR